MASQNSSQGVDGVIGTTARANDQRRNTVNELFAALEQNDIAKLKQVADSIKTFDRFVYFLVFLSDKWKWRSSYFKALKGLDCFRLLCKVLWLLLKFDTILNSRLKAFFMIYFLWQEEKSSTNFDQRQEFSFVGYKVQNDGKMFIFHEQYLRELWKKMWTLIKCDLCEVKLISLNGTFLLLINGTFNGTLCC